MLCRFISLQVLFMTLCQVWGQCPGGWMGYSGNCYRFYTSNRLNWVQAAAECAQHSAHLTNIHSADEDKFISDHLRPHIDESEGSDKQTSVWIGGTDDQQEGQWVWYQTDEPIVEYTNWYPGEPDTGDGDHEEDCVCIVGNHGYKWQDHNCKEPMFFVCQIANQNPTVG